MCFRLIDAEKAQHAVSRLCEVLGVSRAGYYAWTTRFAAGDAWLRGKPLAWPAPVGH